MKKAFTLVELLATIVILGVLLLIAVPTVSNIITNSKRTTFLYDAKTYLQQAKYIAASEDASNDLIKFYNVEEIELDNDGISPFGGNYRGYILYYKGKYGITLWDSLGNTLGTNGLVFTDAEIQNSDFISNYQMGMLEIDNQYFLEKEAGWMLAGFSDDDKYLTISKENNGNFVASETGFHSKWDQVVFYIPEYNELKTGVVLNDNGQTIQIYESIPGVSTTTWSKDSYVTLKDVSRSDAIAKIKTRIDKYNMLTKNSLVTKENSISEVKLLSSNDYKKFFNTTCPNYPGQFFRCIKQIANKDLEPSNVELLFRFYTKNAGGTNRINNTKLDGFVVLEAEDVISQNIMVISFKNKGIGYLSSDKLTEEFGMTYVFFKLLFTMNGRTNVCSIGDSECIQNLVSRCEAAGTCNKAIIL